MGEIQPTKRPTATPSAGSLPATRQSRATAAASRALGLFFYAVMVISLSVIWNVGDWVEDWGVGGLFAFGVLTLLGVGSYFLGPQLIFEAKRHTAPSAQTLLTRDPRPPVPYFRSFSADRISTGQGEEEQLAKLMQDVGPFVAIGDPGELLPYVGAARFYVPDKEWRRAVHDLLTNAPLVILRLGRSPGFMWEFENALRQCRPEQLLLLVPRDKHLYEDFRQRSRNLMPCDLPPLTHWRSRKFTAVNLQAVIFFDPNWSPTIVNLQTLSLSLFRRSPAHPLIPVLRMALIPLFRNLNLPWRPPGYNRRMISFIALGLFIGLMNLIALVLY